MLGLKKSGREKKEKRGAASATTAGGRGREEQAEDVGEIRERRRRPMTERWTGGKREKCVRMRKEREREREVCADDRSGEREDGEKRERGDSGRR